MLNFRSVLKRIYFTMNTFFLPSFSFEVIDFQSCRRSRTLPLIGSGRNANTESLVNNAAAATSIGGGVWLMSRSWPVFGSRPANAWPHHVQWGQSAKLTFINGAQLTHHIWNPDWRMSDSGPGDWGWPGPLCFSVNDGVDWSGKTVWNQSVSIREDAAPAFMSAAYFTCRVRIYRLPGSSVV